MAVSAIGRSHVGRPDFWLIGIVTGLTIIGLLAVYSASIAVGLHDFNDANYFIIRQALGTVMGLFVLVVMARFPYRALARLSPLILLVSLISLALVLIPGIGHGANGATRWIRLGPLPPLQPSEFAKLAMVIYIAAWLAAKGDQVKQFSLGVAPFVMMVGLVGGLVMAEPDLGTFLVIVVTTSTMFFVAGATIRHIVTLFIAGLACIGVLILLEAYRLRRILSFLFADSDPDGLGFQILQLLVALGSGGLHGVGFGASRQKFLYIPGAHTDGIFAIVGEETGFLGCMLVLALLAGFTVRGLRTASIMRDRDTFGFLLAVGITCWIAYQSVINIMGVARMAPLTGIPLPFLSYGSSALVTTMAAVGILLNISRHARGDLFLSRKREREGRVRRNPS